MGGPTTAFPSMLSPVDPGPGTISKQNTYNPFTNTVLNKNSKYHSAIQTNFIALPAAGLVGVVGTLAF